MEQELIDARELAQEFDLQEHSRRADAYFASIRMDSVVARKPFAASAEAASIVSGLSPVLAGLRLFHGARVLDFGAGTCWLSRVLALLGCDVTAADISANALGLGRQIIEGDPLGAQLKVRYAVLNGASLPFPDKSFDRVVVFDAFHHCPDQHAMIREFARILADDGIAMFHEPGPNHSRMDQSQFEMRRFGVIEGDVIVEDLFATAKEAGFTDAELALHLERPLVVDLDQYNAFLRDSAGAVGNWLAASVQAECQNRRVFMLYKGKAKLRDSRSSEGLLASLDLSAAIEGDGVRVTGTATNIGVTRWLPSAGEAGSVNIGVHLEDEDGHPLDNDHARAMLSHIPVEPGESCPVDGVIPMPDMARFRITVDLVAECIAWFQIGGTQAVTFAVDREAGTVRKR